jgi:dTDP-4-amino-4,6-dideoxygalactose transaminase
LLKQAGLPIFRWDDMAVSDCAVATRYRSQLLHLPCHQSLSERQMDWMVSVVTQVLA